MSDLSLWLTVLLAALISLVAIYFAVSPLLQPGPATLVLEDDKLAGLLARKDMILQAIKDLEFDYRVGKMSEEDYRRIDQRLRRQAIGLMQQIEKVAPASASLDEELESIIAQFRKTSSTPLAGTDSLANGDTPVALPVAVSASAPTTSPVSSESQPTRFCTQCGKAVEAGHKFCAYCGTPVAQADPAA